MADPTQEEVNARLATLLSRHRTSLLCYILACVRDRNDAEELLQEVSVTAFCSFEKLRNDSEFLPWAREIARRHVLSFFRKSSRPICYDSELVDLLAETANRMGVQNESNVRGDALAECLSKLPGKSRTVMMMRYDDSSSGVDEIARYLGRSMSATYGVLKRIRMTLRSCVEKKLAAEGSLNS